MYSIDEETMKSVIVDYGMGNLHSLAKAIKRLGHSPRISDDPALILDADKLFLPGVGHFKEGMARLQSKGLLKPLTEKVLNEKTPLLGICLGMQLLTKHSEEGDVPGLGWINATTTKFTNDAIRVPHIGWNTIAPAKDHPLLAGVATTTPFYFVHSYYVTCETKRDILATTEYGTKFVSAVQKENIIGVQFHPEKSHDEGLKIIKHFLEDTNV